MDEEDLPYYDDDGAWDGTYDHVKTMRRPKEENRTLVQLHKGPWEWCQAIRSLKELNASVKYPFLRTK